MRLFLRKTMTDLLTVYNDDRLVYSLKNGTEITIELGEKIEKSPNSTVVDAVRGLLCVSKYYAYCSYISPMHQITTNAVIVTKVSIVIP